MAAVLSAAAQADTSQGIVLDGLTQSSLSSPSSDVFDIHTQTIRGSNAFNSFHHFQVGEGQVANLYLPTVTSNLINLVHDSRVVVRGTVNSFKDGAIGGNVIFADPHGFLVGGGGVLNVGSLAVATPTAGFMGQLIAPDGQINDVEVSRLLSGDIPISADGLIQIEGRVNALDSIALYGQQVSIAGQLHTQLLDPDHQSLFNQAVNTADLKIGTELFIEDGDILILAAGDVAISGEIQAQGRAAHSGGTVLITAGGHVSLQDGSRIDASGQGMDSSGGTILVYGEQTAQTQSDVQLSARGGESGDGGFIEVSGREKVTIGGGSYDTSASDGQHGQFLIDPFDLEIIASVSTSGNMYMQADNSIVVRDGVTIDTSGPSGAGDITLAARLIQIDETASLLAQGDGVNPGGVITLEAISQDETKLGVASAESRIDVFGTLKGEEIRLIAHAGARVHEQALDTDLLRGLSNDLLSGILDEIPAFDLGFGIADASAQIVVHDTAVLEAAGDIHLDAHALREVSLDSQANGDLLGVAAVYGELKGRTAAEIRQGAEVRAGGQLLVEAHSDNTLRLDASTQAGDNEVYFAGTLAIGIARDLETHASVHLNALDDLGEHAHTLVVHARGDNDFQVTANNQASPGGSVGIAAAVLDASLASSAEATGDIHTGAALIVAAQSDTQARQVVASTTAAAGGDGGENSNPAGDSDGVADFISGLTRSRSDAVADDPEQVPPGGESDDAGLPLDIGAAVAISLGGASSIASLGDGAMRAGDVAVLATVDERNLQTHALSGASSVGEDGDGNPLGIAAAVAVTGLHLQASAGIEQDVQIQADRVAVLAQVDLPLRAAWGEDENTGSIDNLGQSQPDDVGSYLTSYASSSLESGADTQVGLGGAVNYLHLKVDSQAYVDGEVQASGAGGEIWQTSLGGQQWDWEQAVVVRALSRVETVDVAGNVTGFGSAVGIGGVFNWVNHVVNTQAQIGSDALIQTSGLLVNAEGTHRLYAYAPVSGSGDGGTLGLGAAGVYASQRSSTHAELLDGAQVNPQRPAPGDPEPPAPDHVAIIAVSRNTLDVAASSIASGDQTVGLSATVAYVDLQVDTHAIVGAGNTLHADDLLVYAHNETDFSLSASAHSEGSAALGIAAAIADIQTDAYAGLKRDAQLDGGLLVAALSDTSQMKVVASTSVANAPGDGGEEDGEGELSGGKDQGSTAFVAGRTEAASDQARDSDADNASAPGTGDDGGFPLKIGAAVAINLASERAVAQIVDGVEVEAAGDVVVYAQRRLEHLLTQAESAAASTVDGEKSGSGEAGSGVSISAAVAVGIIDQQARALIGDWDEQTDTLSAAQLRIEAGRIGVGAQLQTQARSDETPGIADYLDEDGTGGADGLNGYASATLASADDLVSIAGAVNYLDLSSQAEARIGSGASLVLHADASPDPWNASHAGEVLHSFAAVLSVDAHADVVSVTVAGNRAEQGKVGIGGAFNWVQQNTHVRAESLAADTSLLGQDGDVAILAQRDDTMVVLTPVSGSAGETLGVGAGVALGMFNGSSRATLDSGTGTGLQGSGAVQVRATASTDTTVEAITQVSGNASVGFSATVSYAQINADTEALARGTLVAGQLQLEAENHQSHFTHASARVAGGAALGIAAAVADIDIQARALLGGDVTAPDGVSVAAYSNTARNEVEATTLAESGAEEDEAPENAGTSSDDRGSTDFARGKADKGDDKLGDSMGKLDGQDGDGGGDDSGGFDLKLGAVLALNFSSQSTTASIEDNTQIHASNGDVAVIAHTTDSGIRNWAESGTTSSSEDEGLALQISAAVAVGLYDYNAHALVGNNVLIQAEHIGIGANVMLPLGANLDKWTDLDGWLDFFQTKPGLDELDGDITAWAKDQIHTYASATTSSSGDSIDIAGAVNYVDFSNSAIAWVGEGTQLNASGSAGPWQSDYATDQQHAWAQTISIAADVYTATIDVAGNFSSLLSPGQSSDGGTLAIGAAFNWVNHSNTAIAGIGEGAIIEALAGELHVAAHAFDQVIAISPTSGGGAGIAGNGILSLTLLDNHTSASISDGVDISARAVHIEAAQELSIWSISGALTSADNAAVGIAVAANDLNTETLAFIGDNRHLDPFRSGEVLGDSAADGLIRTNRLQVQAHTSGLAGSGAVAGAMAGGSASGGDGEESGDSAQSDDGLSGRTGTALQGRTDQTNQETDALTERDDAILAEGSDKLNEGAEKSEDPDNPKSEDDERLTDAERQGDVEDEFLADSERAKSGSGSDDSSKKNFGIAISGSATVNLSALETRAWISATEVAALDAGSVELNVAALNDTDLISVSGAGALVRAGKNASGPQVAIAGAVSYNVLANITEAAIYDSVLNDLGAVNVHAITSGDQLAIALGLAANTAASDSKSASVAGSVSIARTRNETLAGIFDSHLDGVGTGDVDVLAYDRSRILAGGGALTVGGAIGVGAAVSVNMIENTTRAQLAGATLMQFDAVDVRALSSSRILGMAAMVGFNKGKAALGGSVVFNQIKNTIDAGIVDGSSLDVQGDVTVQASGTELDPAAAQALTYRDNGVDFDASVLDNPEYQHDSEEGSLEDAPQIDAPSIRGEAIIGIAGTITGSSKAAVGLSFAGNWIESSYTARIENATVVSTGEVSVLAADSAVIIGLGVAGGASGKFAGMGAGVANVIRSSAEALVIGKDGGVSVDVDARSLSVQARKDADIYTLAGSLAFSGKASIGASVAYNEITHSTLARLDGAGVQVSDAVEIEALSSASIYGAAIAGAAAGQFALGGSAVINRIGQQVSAGVDGSHVSADSMRVAAGDSNGGQSADIWALSGGIAAAGKAAVGAAVAYNEIGGWGNDQANQFTAVIVDSNLQLNDTLDVTANSAANIQTLAATGSFAGKIAAGGSVAISNISTTLNAELNGSDLNTAGSAAAESLHVSVQAGDYASIRSAAGALQVSGKAAVGLATAVNRIHSDVHAGVAGNLSGTGLHVRNLLVDAHSASSIQTLSAGLSASGLGGIAGSVSVNLLGGSTTAAIKDGALVQASNNVGVIAENRDVVQVIAGAMGIGFKVGAAASVMVNHISSETHAYIDGAQTRVTALASQAEGLEVNDGSLANRPGLIAIARNNTDDNRSADEYAEGLSFDALHENRSTVHGLAVNASSSQRVAVAGTTLGFSFNPYGSIGLAGTVNVNQIGGATSAYVNAATLNEDNSGAGATQQVVIRASSHTHNTSMVVGAAGGLIAAGGAVSVDLINRHTSAYMQGGLVNSGSLQIDARATQGITAIAAGAAVGAGALAASAPIILTQGSTQAWIDGSDVRVGDLSVMADTDTAFSLIAGSVSGGGLAGAAALALLSNETITQAYVQNSLASGLHRGIDASGDLLIEASAHSQINTFVAGAAFGSTGLAGMASVILLDASTEAWLENATVGQTLGARSIQVLASDTVNIDAMAGGIALGGDAAGAAANILIGSSRTEAGIHGAVLYTDGAVEVAAERDWDVDLLTMSGAVAGTAGIGGGISLILLGQGDAGSGAIGEVDRRDGENSESGGTLSAVDRLSAAAVYDDEENLLSAEEKAALKGGSVAPNTAERVRNGKYNGVRALMSDSQIISGLHTASLSVTAEDHTRTLSTTGAVGIGLTGAGIGAAAGITRNYSVIEASVSGSNQLTGLSSIDVHASAADGASGAAATVNVLAGGFSAGLAGLGAAYADARVENTVTARLGGAAIGSTNGIAVSAADRSTVSTDTKGAGAAAGVAVGLSLSHAYKSSTVTAELAQNAVIVGSPSLFIEALSDGSVSATATGVAGGLLLAGSGADARARDSATVSAGIGANALVNLNMGGSLVVDAKAVPRAQAHALGVSVAGTAAIGVSLARAESATQVNAYLGNQAWINGSDLSISFRAASETDNGAYGAYAKALAGAGAMLASAAGADARVIESSTVKAWAGDGAQIINLASAPGTTATGSISFEAGARPRVFAEGEGISAAAGLAFGVALANATVLTQVDSWLGNNVVIDGTRSSLRLIAYAVPGGARAAEAQVYAGTGGGLVGANGARASASNSSQVRAWTGSNVQLPGHDVELRAVNSTDQLAQARSLAVGLLAAGLISSQASSNTTTQAWLGANNQAAGASTGNIDVLTLGENRDRADAVSGTGGVIAGSAASVSTSSHANNSARILGNHQDVLKAGVISVNATQRTFFSGTVDSTRASLAGASGARATHTVNSNVTTRIDNDAQIEADGINLRANNLIEQLARGNNISVAAGGFLNGSAGRADTTMNATTRVEIGNGARLSTVAENGSGNIVIDVLNSIKGIQRARLDTGGAVDIARVESNVTSNNIGEILFGDNSRLSAAGNLRAGVRTDADIESAGNSRTHGLAGFAQGRATVYLDVDHLIRVGSNARVEAADDIALLSGYDSSGNRGQLSAYAHVYVLNRTAIPISTDPRAHADLTTTNNIDVHAGSEVVAGRDAVLRTSQGIYAATGEGRGKDVYREVAEKVGNFFVKVANAFGANLEEVNLEIRRDSRRIETNDRILLNGNVIAGASTYEYLIITEDQSAPWGLNIESSRGVEVSISEVDILDELKAQLDQWQATIDLYEQMQGEEGYQENSQLWIAMAQAKTLDDQIKAIESGETKVLQVDVANITARGGNIHFETSSLSGNGNITLAPQPENMPSFMQAEGAPSVLLLNRTDSFLRTNDISIEQGGGQISLLSSRQVFGVAIPQFQNLAGQSSYQGIQITSPQLAGNRPEVVIVNDYDPPGGVGDIPPWIRLEGKIDNPTGLVEIINRRGTIMSTGEINAAELQMRAGGDFIQMYRPGIDWIADENGMGGGRIFGGRIYISAEYININGLIRSGMPDWSVSLDSSHETMMNNHELSWLAGMDAISPWIEWLRHYYNDDELTNLLRLWGQEQTSTVDPMLKLTGGEGRNIEWGTLSSYYNAEADQIELTPEAVSGGYVFLFGHILNTGCHAQNVVGCGIEARSGYGDIRIENTTSREVVLRNLDIGEPANGVIEIWDTGKADAEGNPWLTMMEHDYQSNLITRTEARLNIEFQPVEGQPGQTEAVVVQVNPASSQIDGRTTTYNPAAGYSILDWNNNEYVMPSWLANMYESIYSWFTGMDIEAHRADLPINVNFIGNSAGTIHVNSTPGVVIDGTLRNPEGSTTIITQGGISQRNSNATVQGETVILQAQTGIGSADNPLNLRVGSGGLSATSQLGNIYLTQSGDDLWLTQLSTGAGHIDVNASHSIYNQRADDLAAVSGSSITLMAGGDIGSDSRALNIDSGLGVALVDGKLPLGAAAVNVSAGADVSLRELDGDLQAGKLVAGGHLRITVDNGDLVNILERGELDQQTIERLESLWEELRLTEEWGAGEAIAESIAAYEGMVAAEYAEYWLLHGLSNGQGEFDLDEQAQDMLRYAALRELLPALMPEDDMDLDGQTIETLANGLSSEQIAQYASERYQELVSVFAERYQADDLSNIQDFVAYNENFQYDAPQALKDQIAEGAIWTIDELMKGISAAALVEVTETQFEKLEANLIAEHIEIYTPNGRIGAIDDPVVINFPSDPEASFAFTPEQIAALIAAQPGDISIIGDAVLNEFGDIESGTVEGLVIQRTRPVGLLHGADGSVHAEAGINGDIYLAATDALMNLVRISAGGQIRLQSRSGLYNTLPDETVIFGAANGLLLEGGDGAIGSADAPLRMSLSDTAYLTARADGDIFLQEVNGSLSVERIFSQNGAVNLQAAVDILAWYQDALVDIRAHDIILTAGGNIGSEDNALDIDTVAEAMLTATAGGDIHLHVPQGDLYINQIQANGDVSLDVQLSIRGSGDVELGIADIVGAAGSHATLHAGTGIGLEDSPLIVDIPHLDAMTNTGGIHIYSLSDLSSDYLHAANGPVDVSVDGRLDFGSIIAGDWIRLRSLEDMIGDSLVAQFGITLSAGFDRFGEVANQAWIRINELDALWANMHASTGIALTEASVYQYLHMQADYIEANVSHSADDGRMLEMQISGSSSEAAIRADLNVDAPAGLSLPVFASTDSLLTTTASHVDLPQAYVPGSMEIQTPHAHVYMNNRSPAPHPSTIQLYETSYRFFLEQTDRHSYTSAYVVWYAPGHTVAVPNYHSGHGITDLDYEGASVVRDSERFAESITRALLGTPTYRSPDEEEEDLIDMPEGIGVNTRQDGIQTLGMLGNRAE